VICLAWLVVVEIALVAWVVGVLNRLELLVRCFGVGSRFGLGVHGGSDDGGF
jgi:hypothetical protein